MKFAYVPWEAFATLLTGGLAVGAAVFVGLKQQTIIRRQTEIESAKTRIELFDRRIRIVDLHSKLLSMNYGRNERLPFVRDFMDERGSVSFLFDEDVARLLDRAYEISVDMDHGDDDPEATRKLAAENRTVFLAMVSPYMRVTEDRS